MAGFTLEDVLLARDCWAWLQNKTTFSLEDERPEGLTEEAPYLDSPPLDSPPLGSIEEARRQLIASYVVFRRQSPDFKPPLICVGAWSIQPEELPCNISFASNYNYPGLHRAIWLAARDKIIQSNARGEAAFRELAAIAKPTDPITPGQAAILMNNPKAEKNIRNKLAEAKKNGGPLPFKPGVYSYAVLLPWLKEEFPGDAMLLPEAYAHAKDIFLKKLG